MKLELLKSRENNEKRRLFRGKIAKSAVTFHKNKANFKNIIIGVSFFQTSKYEILPAWWGKKTNPSKPNLSQNKANSNPICLNAIIGISSFLTSKYEKFEGLAG
ncbi:MAG: hypothetical protein JSV82_02355 [Planctomycetota bacterium]|nr:MAG: hypothetical protein JSV82_02355 [Planctomycetota bacterium]